MASLSRRIFASILMIYSPRSHYSIIPVFQHSNWGEAPKFISLNGAKVITLQKVLEHDSAQNALDARREISEE